ncbi:MAG: hypothetical protein ACR2QC_00460 [Gammaproteobacteria bacterium]
MLEQYEKMVCKDGKMPPDRHFARFLGESRRIWGRYSPISGRIRRFRRCRPKYTHAAIPAKAGISIRRKANPPFALRAKEIPAFAGMAVFAGKSGVKKRRRLSPL